MLWKFKLSKPYFKRHIFDGRIFANRLLANLTFANRPFANLTVANPAICQPDFCQPHSCQPGYLPTRLLPTLDLPTQQIEIHENDLWNSQSLSLKMASQAIWGSTSKGKKMLYDQGGYKYHFVKSQNEKTTWYCAERKKQEQYRAYAVVNWTIELITVIQVWRSNSWQRKLKRNTSIELQKIQISHQDRFYEIFPTNVI